MVRAKNSSDKQLTEVELEMMQIIWRIGPATVHQILEKLPKERDLAYTTVSTMVRILEQKRFVTSRKDGRGHIYSAAVSQDDYEASSVSHLVKNLFHGEPTQLVRALFASKALRQEDLDAIAKLLKEKSQS